MTIGRFDDAVVGAGIVGLVHAYALAQRGRKVIVFERRPRPQGASVRNFGMLWPTALVDMLRDVMDVRFEMHTQVTVCEPPRIAAGSRTWEAERAWICAGDELQALFPRQLEDLGLVRCKLQMMRTEPLETQLGPMLAAGLTLQHYASFRKCPSLPALQQRFAAAYPDHLRYGIHVMVSQNGLGELTIGDSHEYGDAITPFDNASIDWLILDYLKRFLNTSPARIQSRWHGYYVKHPTQPYAVLTPSTWSRSRPWVGTG